MLFQDILSLLQQQKYVGRANQSWYIFLLPQISELQQVHLPDNQHPLFDIVPYNPTIQDLLASDWEVIQ